METPFPAYRGDEPYIFVCYSHDDAGSVFPELEALRSDGINVYYDEGISPGHEWTQELADAIDGCSRFLYFVSPASIASRHCRNEVQYALDKEKRLVSVYLEPTELPGGLHLSLGSAQAILRYELSAEDYQRKLSRTFGSSTTSGDPLPALRTGNNGRPARETRLPKSRWWWVASASVVLAVLGLLLWVSDRTSPNTANVDLSIAVLPMSIVGDDAAVRNYADALTAELRSAFAGYQELRMVSPNEVSPADAAPASYLLGGNVQRLGDRIRLRPQLTRVDDAETVWSEPFDRSLSNSIADPSELAKTLSRFVRTQLIQDQQCESVRRTSSSEEAAAAYCEAFKEFYRAGQVGDIDLEMELRNARHAIALDPEIADAYRIAARAQITMGFLGVMDWRDACRRARADLSKGFALAPNDPRLFYVAGGLQYFLELNYAAAEASFRASLDADPLHPDAYQNYYQLGLLKAQLGDIDGALADLQRALRVNDADGQTYVVYSSVLFWAGRYRDALRAADIGLALVRGGYYFPFLSSIRALAFAALGENEQASEALDQALAKAPQLRYRLVGHLKRVGRTIEAQALLNELEATRKPPIVDMVSAYAAFEDDRVFEWLHKAIDERATEVVLGLRANPIYSALRRDERWNEVMVHLEAEEAKAANGNSCES